MALIRLGSLVTRISGKIGGQTFGTGPSGSYVRNTGTPRKSITILQRDKMSLMATTAQSWRALTQAQRDVFNSASPDYTYLNRVGETKNYSGFAIYTQLRNNVSNTVQTFPPLELPVPLPRVSFLPFDDFLMSVQSTAIVFQAEGATENMEYRVFTSKISSRGVSNSYANLYFMGKATATESGAITINVQANYVAKYGARPGRGKLFFRCDVVDPQTGQSLKGLASGSLVV